MKSSSPPTLPFHRLITLAALVVLMGTPATNHAADATWLLAPPDGDWKNPLNWSTNAVPAFGDTATFVISNIPVLTISSPADIATIHFTGGLNPYHITITSAAVGPGGALSLYGTGIINATGAQQFTTQGAPYVGGRGEIAFYGNATAGTGTTFTNQAAPFALGNGGQTSFRGNSLADQASFFNNGGQFGGPGGTTVFEDFSSADQASITNHPGTGVNDTGGATQFLDQSNAGTAHISNKAGTIGVPDINFPGTNNGARGGGTSFADQATAGYSKIDNSGTAIDGSLGGFTSFSGSSNAGYATIRNIGAVGNPAFLVGTPHEGGGGTVTFSETASALFGTFENFGGFEYGRGGSVSFRDDSTAAFGQFSNETGAPLSFGGVVEFFDHSTAAAGAFTNEGGGSFSRSGGLTLFRNSSTAGHGIFTNNGGVFPGPFGLPPGGATEFFNTSSADHGTFINNGSLAGTIPGKTIFHHNSTADAATLIANTGGMFGIGGSIVFADHSTGGTSRVQLHGNGSLDISPHDSTGVTIGSLEGDGYVYLGSNRLTIGSNNLDTTFTGIISDGGSAGGTGGSLVKTGTGMLLLTGDNTFTGGTLVLGGTLQTTSAEAFIHGPVQLGLGAILIPLNGIFNVTSGSSSIHGGRVIINETFDKNGGGTLVTNTFLQVNGVANINQGSLIVNGTLEADRANVFHGALLGGSGVIFGDVFNSGTVAPGNSPGTLTIIGNYTQTSIGTLQIEIASEKVFDRLIVSGTARLDGTLDIRNYHGNTLSYGQQVPFLQAGKIVGTFDEILMPEEELFRGRFLNAGNTGILLVAPTSYTLVAETPNQTRVAQALDRWIGIEDGDIGGVTLALDLLTAEQYPAAFEAIMPGYYEAALSTGIELSQNQGQMLFQQLSSRRLGGKPQAVSAPAPITSGKGTKNVAPVQPQVAVAEGTQWNGWMQGSGLFSEGGLSLSPGEDFDSGTFMVGADFAVSEHVSLGLFASYQEGWGDYDNAGEIDLESVRFGGYATFDYEGFYASGAVGGGTTDYSVARPIQWATLDRTARSDPDGTEFFTLLGTGYDFHAGNFTFGPSLSAQYTKLKLDEFTETGADSLSLRIKDAEEESLRTYLGGRIAYTMKVSDWLTVIPELRAFWEHEFLQGGENLHASLNGGDGPAFGYVTEEPGKDAMYVGAGLNFELGANFTTSVYYHANFGRNDDAQHTVSVSANWRF